MADIPADLEEILKDAHLPALLNAMVRDNLMWHELQVVKNLQIKP